MELKRPRIATLPQEGDDARSQGPADQNGSVSAIERSGEPRSELSGGPKIGNAGEFLPARYEQTSTIQNKDGSVVTVKQIVEDR